MDSDKDAGGKPPCSCERCKASKWTVKLIMWLPPLINLAVHGLSEWLRWGNC
jgi:hypothetical protein